MSPDETLYPKFSVPDYTESKSVAAPQQGKYQLLCKILSHPQLPVLEQIP